MSTNERAVRAYGYQRVSTTAQVSEGQSLDVQRQQISAEAKHRGFELLEIIEDAGISGRRDDRPGWRRLTAMCEAGEVDVVIVASLSRLGRTAGQIVRFTDRLDNLGVGFISVKEGLDLGSPYGKLLRTVLGALAELEIEITRERTMGGKREAIQVKGIWPGGPPPVGWRSVGEGRVEPDPAEQRALEVIKHGYLVDGVSSAEIARRLDAEGIRPRRGANWNPASIRRIAVNPVLWSGEIVYGQAKDETVRGRMRSTKTDRQGAPMSGEPLVVKVPSPPWTRAEFDAVGKAVSERRDRSNQTSRQTAIHPLSGHLMMPCGARAYGVDLSKSLKNTGARAYRCSGKRSSAPCSCSQLQAQPIEDAVFERLAVLIFDPKALGRLVARWFDGLRDQTQPDRLRDLEAQRDQIQARIDRLVDLAMETDSATVARKIVDLEARLDAVSEEIDTARADQAEIDAQEVHWSARLRDVAPRGDTNQQDLARLADVYRLDVRVLGSHRGHAQRVEVRGVLTPGGEVVTLGDDGSEYPTAQSSSRPRPSAASWRPSCPPARSVSC